MAHGYYKGSFFSDSSSISDDSLAYPFFTNWFCLDSAPRSSSASAIVTKCYILSFSVTESVLVFHFSGPLFLWIPSIERAAFQLQASSKLPLASRIDIHFFLRFFPFFLALTLVHLFLCLWHHRYVSRRQRATIWLKMQYLPTWISLSRR